MAAEFQAVKGTNGQAEHPLQLPFLVRVAKEVERTSVHGGEIFAVFIWTVGGRYDNHWNLDVLALGAFHNVAVGPVFELKTAEACSDLVARHKPHRGFRASARLDSGPAAIQRFREVVAELRVGTDDEQAGRFILISARKSASNDGFDAVGN